MKRWGFWCWVVLEAVCLLLCHSVLVAGPWATEVVDDTPGSAAAIDTSIALDSSGSPRISFCRSNSPDDRVRYASRNGGLWSVEDVHAGRCATTSLALDASDEPHIAFMEDPSRDVVYARREGASWVSETVHAQGGIPALDVKSDGSPCVIFHCEDTNWEFRFGQRTHGTWATEKIADAGGGTGKNLCIDAADTPHVAWPVSDRLMYATAVNGAWDVEEVSRGARDTSIAVDAQLRPHIAHYRNGSEEVLYTTWNGTGWETDVVATESIAGQDTAIALGPAGNPRLVWLSAIGTGGARLKHAAWTGSSWDIETVDAGPYVMEQPSLTVDSQGFSHIAYGKEGVLMYAVGVPEPATMALLAIGGMLTLRRRRR